MNSPLSEIVPPSSIPARYTARSFPPYRYVPGIHPHPVAHPQGHSHNPSGAHPEAGPLLPPDRWHECDDYLYGVDLYNHWYWWEAHEAWEGVWQQSDKAGVQGRFLQGLIQVSAAQLKRHVGQPEGVQRLLARSAEHLDFVQSRLGNVDRYMGLNVRSFRQSVGDWFAGTSLVFPFIHLGEA